MELKVIYIKDKKNEANKKHLQELSKKEKILVLPEEDTLSINNGVYEILGNRPYYIFDNGDIITFNSSNSNYEKFMNLSNAEELLKFMDENIVYGYIDKNGGNHINNLKGYDSIYKVSSIEKILNSHLGTCIEQTKLEKYFFDKNDIQNKAYCYRGYKDNELDEMHCWILFKKDNKWYHLEHSNRDKEGIYAYDNINDAIDGVTSEWNKVMDKYDITEIKDFKDGLSFDEFNEYIDGINESNAKSL